VAVRKVGNGGKKHIPFWTWGDQRRWECGIATKDVFDGKWMAELAMVLQWAGLILEANFVYLSAAD